MNKQELKEKILEIIDNCTEEEDDSTLCSIRYKECVDEIEALFKEVE